MLLADSGVERTTRIYYNDKNMFLLFLFMGIVNPSDDKLQFSLYAIIVFFCVSPSFSFV